MIHDHTPGLAGPVRSAAHQGDNEVHERTQWVRVDRHRIQVPDQEEGRIAVDRHHLGAFRRVVRAA